MARHVNKLFQCSDPMTVVRSVGGPGDYLDHYLRTRDFPALRQRLAAPVLPVRQATTAQGCRRIIADLHNVHPLDAGMIGQVLERTRDIQVHSTQDLELLLSFTIQQGEPREAVRRRVQELFPHPRIPADLEKRFRGLLETYVLAGDDAEDFNACADMEMCHLSEVTIRRMLPIFHVRMDRAHRLAVEEVGGV